MRNNLLRRKKKKKKSVSALVGEKKYCSRAGDRAFFILSMCFSFNKTVFHFGSLVRRPKRSRKLNAKLGMFSKLSYDSCSDAVKYVFVCSF